MDLQHRYWVFGYNNNYASGGLEDLQFTSNELKDAKYQAECIIHPYNVIYIVDTVGKERINITP